MHLVVAIFSSSFKLSIDIIDTFNSQRTMASTQTPLRGTHLGFETEAAAGGAANAANAANATNDGAPQVVSPDQQQPRYSPHPGMGLQAALEAREGEYPSGAKMAIYIFQEEDADKQKELWCTGQGALVS